MKMRFLALVIGMTFGGTALAQTSGATTAPATPAPQLSVNALGPQASAAAIESCNSKMQALLAALDKGDYAGAEMDFNDTMKAGLSPDQLKQAWQSLPTRFGQPISRGSAHNSMSNGYVVITVPMTYQNANLAAQIACGADGKIAGFHAMTLPVAAPGSSSSTSASSSG
jgi:hypothetical protein